MSRPILKTTKGIRVGPNGVITRLISPDAEGKHTKPFVFLDLLQGVVQPNFGFPYHPHSGIATLTYQKSTDVQYTDTEEREGILKANGLEWMQAGLGAWHKASLPQGGQVNGFQLWIALPASLELTKSFSNYYEPSKVPLVENVKILLGSYKGTKSPIKTPSEMNYFDIEIANTEEFVYEIPKGHLASFAVVYEGSCIVDGKTFTRELLIFQPDGGDLLKFKSVNGPCSVLLGSGVPHPFDIVTGHSSVHTSIEALEKGEQKIKQLGDELRKKGKLR